MKVKILTTGVTSEDYIIKGIEAYLQRLTPMLNVHYEELRTGKYPKKTNTDTIKKQESRLQLHKIQSGDYLILLDEQGKQLNSVQFSEYLQQYFNTSVRNLVFLIGGAYGFDKAVHERADEVLSLSSMTFTHQMVRLIFVEQLYRALTILKGLPYHHT